MTRVLTLLLAILVAGPALAWHKVSAPPYSQYCSLESDLVCANRSTSVTYTRASTTLCPDNLAYTDNTTLWASLSTNVACHLAGSGLHVNGKIYNYVGGSDITTGTTANLAAGTYTYWQTDTGALGTVTLAANTCGGGSALTVNGSADAGQIVGNSVATGTAVVVSAGTGCTVDATVNDATGLAWWQLSDREFVTHRIDNADNWPGGSTFVAAATATLPTGDLSIIAGGATMIVTTDWTNGSAPAAGDTAIFAGNASAYFELYLPGSGGSLALFLYNGSVESATYVAGAVPTRGTAFVADAWWNNRRFHVRYNGLATALSDKARTQYPAQGTAVWRLGHVAAGYQLGGWIKDLYLCPGPIGCNKQVQEWENP